MDDRILKYLEDILSAIVEIDEEVDTRCRQRLRMIHQATVAARSAKSA